MKRDTSSPSPTPVRVGAAEVDITAPLGTHLSGDLARHRPAEEILDPLFAKALVVEGPDERGALTRFCFLSLDLLSIEAEKTARIRSRIEKRVGIPGSAVLVHATQNHSAPGLGHFLLRRASPYVPAGAWWLYGCQQEYEDFVVARVTEAVREAADRLEPVEVAMGGMADGRISFNRRFRLRDGSVQTQPRSVDLHNVLCPEGPSDPEVGVACFRNREGKTTAALLHHTAHPVSHFGRNAVSASWPGAWRRRFRELAGSDCVAMVVNGCCGNVNIRNALDPGRVCDDERVGDWLIETTAKVVDGLPYAEPETARFLRRRIDIPYGSLPEDAVANARELLRARPGPEWANKAHTAFVVDWLFGCVVADMAEKLASAPPFPYEIQAFRIGDLALVGLIGEPFVEAQLDIKRDSPAERTFVAHMCNAYVAYIPTPEAYHARNFNYYSPDGRPVRRGANLFQLVPEALDIITQYSRDMLDELFA